MLPRCTKASILVVAAATAFLADPSARAFSFPTHKPARPTTRETGLRLLVVQERQSSENTSPLFGAASSVLNGTSLGQEAESPFFSSPAKTEYSALEDWKQEAPKDAEEQASSVTSWWEPLAWRSVILVLCALWASNFPAAKLVMQEPGVDSSLYALARFGVSALALAPFAWKQRDTLFSSSAEEEPASWDTLVSAVQCGAWVAFGYLGQTLGLLTTTASKSCVICSLHCVFVAAMAELWRVQKDVSSKYNVQKLIPAAVAVAGVAIVELQGLEAGGPTIGDALSFAQPIGFGMGYLLLEDIMERNPQAALVVSALKLSVVAVASLFMFEFLPLLNGGADWSSFALQAPNFGPILASPLALGGILYTGLITTALALWVESIAFAKVPATDASIILTTEPLIAAVLGAVALGETFSTNDFVGAGLIVAACGLAVLQGETSNKQQEQEEDACIVAVDPDCESDRKLPFWGFFL